MRRFILLLLFVLSALPLRAGEDPAPFRPEITDADIDRQLGSEWFGIYLQDKKVGWLKESAVRDEVDGVKCVTGGFTMHVELRRMQDVFSLNMTEKTSYAAAAPHRLVSAILEQNDGTQQKTIAIKRRAEGEGFTIEITENGTPRTLERDDFDVTLADIIGLNIWIWDDPETGDVLRSRTLNIEQLAVDTVKAELEDVTETIVDGVPMKIYVTRMTSHLSGPIGIARLDPEGAPLSLKIGSIFEARREPEDIARKLDVGGDLFALGIAKVDRPLGEAKKARTAVFIAEGRSAGVLESGPRQTVEPSPEDGTVRLLLGEGHGGNADVSKTEAKENLRETANHPINDPAVRELVEKALGDARTDREKAERLVHFVSDYVEDSYSVNPLSVQTIIEQKKGDCSEHAILMTTLARAAGLPTRDVGGLVYMGDATRGFGWHAWNEVAIDGVWVPMDPTWDETELNATHIRVVAGERGSGKVVEAIGGLSFRGVSINGEPLPELAKPKPATPPEHLPIHIDEGEEAAF